MSVTDPPLARDNIRPFDVPDSGVFSIMALSMPISLLARVPAQVYSQDHSIVLRVGFF